MSKEQVIIATSPYAEDDYCLTAIIRPDDPLNPEFTIEFLKNKGASDDFKIVDVINADDYKLLGGNLG